MRLIPGRIRTFLSPSRKVQRLSYALAFFWGCELCRLEEIHIQCLSLFRSFDNALSSPHKAPLVMFLICMTCWHRQALTIFDKWVKKELWITRCWICEFDDDNKAYLPSYLWHSPEKIIRITVNPSYTTTLYIWLLWMNDYSNSNAVCKCKEIFNYAKLNAIMLLVLTTKQYYSSFSSFRV